jgi:hypothetical protein
MSERFGIPDHSPQHAPDHAQQNPTPQESWGTASSGAEWPTTPAPSYGGSYGGSYSGPVVGGSVGDRRVSIKWAIFLAMLFGPLGLFYVGFLNGLVALFVVVPTVRPLAFDAAFALGGRVAVLPILIFFMWCVTVPWAILGALRRNYKIAKKD